MKIVTNHLTRMSSHKICVAGIDVESNKHVRPVFRRKQLTTDLLYENEGVFALGNVIDLRSAISVGSKPEIEDYIFHEDRVSIVSKKDDDEYWSILENNSNKDLWEIFGPDLIWRGDRLVTNTNCGNASLGLWEPDKVIRISRDFYGKIRLIAEINYIRTNFTVADIRLYEQPDWNVKHKLIKKLNQKIEDSEKIILSVGLTRHFRGFHWLQINNLHFVEDPLGPWE